MIVLPIQNEYRTGMLVLVDNMTAILVTALQVGDLERNWRDSKSGLRMMHRSSFSDSK